VIGGFFAAQQQKAHQWSAFFVGLRF